MQPRGYQPYCNANYFETGSVPEVLFFKKILGHVSSVPVPVDVPVDDGQQTQVNCHLYVFMYHALYY